MNSSRKLTIGEFAGWLTTPTPKVFNNNNRYRKIKYLDRKKTLECHACEKGLAEKPTHDFYFPFCFEFLNTQEQQHLSPIEKWICNIHI